MFFKTARADDTGTPNPGRRRGDAQHRPRRFAVGQLSCAAGCTWASTATKRASRCTTACGPSSRAAASR
jgi:hypothetical protein